MIRSRAPVAPDALLLLGSPHGSQEATYAVRFLDFMGAKWLGLADFFVGLEEGAPPRGIKVGWSSAGMAALSARSEARSFIAWGDDSGRPEEWAIATDPPARVQIERNVLYRVRHQVAFVHGITRVRFRIWPAHAPEPTSWLCEEQDARVPAGSATTPDRFLRAVPAHGHADRMVGHPGHRARAGRSARPRCRPARRSWGARAQARSEPDLRRTARPLPAILAAACGSKPHQSRDHIYPTSRSWRAVPKPAELQASACIVARLRPAPCYSIPHSLVAIPVANHPAAGRPPRRSSPGPSAQPDDLVRDAADICQEAPAACDRRGAGRGRVPGVRSSRARLSRFTDARWTAVRMPRLLTFQGAASGR